MVDGPGRDHQLGRDLGVGQAGADEPQDLDLPVGQAGRVASRAGGGPAGQPGNTEVAQPPASQGPAGSAPASRGSRMASSRGIDLTGLHQLECLLVGVAEALPRSPRQHASHRRCRRRSPRARWSARPPGARAGAGSAAARRAAPAQPVRSVRSQQELGVGPGIGTAARSTTPTRSRPWPVVTSHSSTSARSACSWARAQQARARRRVLAGPVAGRGSGWSRGRSCPVLGRLVEQGGESVDGLTPFAVHRQQPVPAGLDHVAVDGEVPIAAVVRRSVEVEPRPWCSRRGATSPRRGCSSRASRTRGCRCGGRPRCSPAARPHLSGPRAGGGQSRCSRGKGRRCRRRHQLTAMASPASRCGQPGFLLVDQRPAVHRG